MFASLLCLPNRLSRLALRLHRDRRGAETLEWAVVGAVVIFGAVVGYHILIGSGIDGFFQNTSTAFGNWHMRF